MTIRFGPAGLGPVKDAISNLEKYHKLGLSACEIAFTYGVYIKNEKDMEEIGKAAKKLDIKLSIHAQYWLNLNSNEKRKIEESKARILECSRVGDKIGAEVVVFHPGYYQKSSPEETYENIKKAILEIKAEIKKKGWKINIAPETMGKINVFGSVEQISKLTKETGCRFCIDFAHVLARDKKVDYEKIKKLFPEKTWHCHFSGIEYNEKGERRHLKTPTSAWKELLKNLPQGKEITIINESPEMVKDSAEGLKLSKVFH